MIAVMDVVGWVLRRPLVMLLYGGLPCASRWCGRRTVGFSVWCRWHTDEILADFPECGARIERGRKAWG